MSELPALGRGDEQAARELLAQYDAPAYVRRARRVQQAYDELLARCERQRAEWLDMVRLRVGLLRALAGGWESLGPILVDAAQLALLQNLHDRLAPQLRAPVEPTSSVRELRRALAELQESIDRFNQRWEVFLASLDLEYVNELRDGYNRYYILEKECALRSPAAARHGFRRLDPLTLQELADHFPPLPMPRAS